MEPGELRHDVTIQSPLKTGNEFGEVQLTWATYADDVPAKVEPLVGRALVNAQQLRADVTHLVTIRYMEGVTSEMQIVHRGRVLKIEGPPINPDEIDEQLLVYCKEVEL